MTFYCKTIHIIYHIIVSSFYNKKDSLIATEANVYPCALKESAVLTVLRLKNSLQLFVLLGVVASVDEQPYPKRLGSGQALTRGAGGDKDYWQVANTILGASIS